MSYLVSFSNKYFENTVPGWKDLSPEKKIEARNAEITKIDNALRKGDNVYCGRQFDSLSGMEVEDLKITEITKFSNIKERPKTV